MLHPTVAASWRDVGNRKQFRFRAIQTEFRTFPRIETDGVGSQLRFNGLVVAAVPSSELWGESISTRIYSLQDIRI